MADVKQDTAERDVVVYSRVTEPIKELSFLRRSLLFSELSMLSYKDEPEARQAAEAIGFSNVQFFDNDGSQAYRFENTFDCVIASRGTEPHEWNDIQADANAATVLAETAGRVHRGFKKEVDDLWPMLELVLRSNTKPLWFCGHSLGGAMATICAARCYLSYIPSNPEQLFTFGSPRVGNRRYVSYVNLKHYRWVNNNDIVARVPPAWMGYCHRGIEVYLDYRGRICRIEGWWRFRDRVLGFLRSLRQFRIDHFTDHSIHRYIEAILLATLKAEGEDQPSTAGKSVLPAPHSKVSAEGLPSAERRQSVVK